MTMKRDYAKERAEIMGIFTDTQKKLEAQNAEIIKEQEDIANQLLELANRSGEIGKVAKQNKTALTKIKKIIGV